MSRMLETDGVLIRETVMDGTQLHGRLHQPTRALILDRNQELRKNPDAVNHMQHAGLELTIPLADYYALQRKYPLLKSVDAFSRTMEWKRLMGTDELDAYRVRDRVKK